MDPKTRRFLWNCLNKIRNKGKSLILTTHRYNNYSFHFQKIVLTFIIYNFKVWMKLRHYVHELALWSMVN